LNQPNTDQAGSREPAFFVRREKISGSASFCETADHFVIASEQKIQKIPGSLKELFKSNSQCQFFKNVHHRSPLSVFTADPGDPRCAV
jgi:hypothetical protein